MVPEYRASLGGGKWASAASAHAALAVAAPQAQSARTAASRHRAGCNELDIGRFQNISADGNIAAPHSPVCVPHGLNHSAIVSRAPSSVAAAASDAWTCSGPATYGNLLFSQKNIWG